MHAHCIYWPGQQKVSAEQNIKFDEHFLLVPAASDAPIEGENNEREELPTTSINWPIDTADSDIEDFKTACSDSPTPPPQTPSPEPP